MDTPSSASTGNLVGRHKITPKAICFSAYYHPPRRHSPTDIYVSCAALCINALMYCAKFTKGEIYGNFIQIRTEASCNITK